MYEYIHIFQNCQDERHEAQKEDKENLPNPEQVIKCEIM